MNKITGRLTASLCVLALLLFFFPWLNISCNDTNVASQSGLQIVYGGFSASSQMQQMQGGLGGGGQGGPQGKQADDQKPGGSFLTLIAFLAVLGSAVIAVATELLTFPLKLKPGLERALNRISHVPVKVGLLTGVALVILLFLSIIAGFPAERKINAQMKSQSAQAQQQNMPVEVSVSVGYSWALYVEMFLLVPPTFLMLNEKYRWVSIPGLTATPAAPRPPAEGAVEASAPPAQEGGPAQGTPKAPPA